MTSNKTIFQGASNSIDLSMPTDLALSREFRTTIATAFPEDFPGFSAEGLINPSNMNERMSAVGETLSKAFSFWTPDSKNEHCSAIAGKDFPFALPFYGKSLHEEQLRLNGFFILKLSKFLSPEQIITKFVGLDDASSIVSPLTWEELFFLALAHEKEHIVQILKKTYEEKNPLLRFGAELGADTSCLYDYIALQKDPLEQNRIINGLIAIRAVSGFLSQPQTYWIAPSLKDTFRRPESRDGDFKTSINPLDVWLSYKELRLRTVAFLRGNSSLYNYDPNQFREALLLSEQGRLREMQDTSLHLEIQHLDMSFNSFGFDKHRKSGAALRALSHITNCTNLLPFTHQCGQQIIDGAKLICPSLLNGNTPKVDIHPNRNPS